MKLNVLFLGRCEYEKALEIQYDILKKRQDGNIEDTLILVEHPPVITMGRRAEKAHIVGSEKLLEQNGIKIFDTNRGGDVTYHGPGQIVGYPIFDLRKYNMGIRKFVENLEEIFISLLKDRYHIDAGRNEEHTGVWIGNSKITAIGLAVKRGVTMHGFAFNVNTNLDHFRFIVPCGISDKGVTSIENQVGKTVDFEEEKKYVLEYFCRVFNYGGYEELDAEKYLI
ncbi:lipoyl(octanoyl) transferase LipB [Wukongibacter baidiensis]|uniref:lipoyl(octanoyl) transferase LipB n=1 Tax=Wukongibacter baidiensis TaxID=1723361 RepID=UPI003D7F9E15